MNVNKKLGRFKQWAEERMGAEVKTNVSDDFKALEVEMGLRHEGLDKMQKTMTSYVKTMSKRNEGDDKEKTLPVARLGGSMIAHGEDFEDNSEFGQCLISLGRANERIARIQETYVASATSSWLESLERSLAQMKEYQAARKKLETRRLAYDTSLAKMQKAKREDFRVEEELRSQKAKYEEAEDDVYRRMLDIRDTESETVSDLGSFLDAELAYYDKCRDVLLQLRGDWPAGSSTNTGARRDPRSRSNTQRSWQDRQVVEEARQDSRSPDPRLLSKTRTTPSYASHYSDEDNQDHRPGYLRSTTFEGPSQLRRDNSVHERPGVARVPSDTMTIRTLKSQLRPTSLFVPNRDVFNETDDSAVSSSPDRSYGEYSVSPATSHGSLPWKASNGATQVGSISTKKGPPPPPPSRAKKPPPPPPPAKRSVVT